MKRAYTNALIVLATASVAVSLTPLVALYFWAFDLFTNFRVQLVAGQIVLLLLLALARSRVACVAIGICVLVNAYSIRHYLMPAARAAGAQPALVEILTANVLGRNGKFAGLLETIERESPDLIVVQEYQPHVAVALAPLDSKYPYRLEIPRNDAFGIALFSKHAFDEAHEFRLQRASAIDARLSIAGREFRLFGVHLSVPISQRTAAIRKAQLEELAAAASRVDEPLVIVGDFNLTPYSPYFTTFLERTDLRDASTGNGPIVTWPTYLPVLGIPIDHCLISADWQVVDYRRQPAYGSDHFPVLVALR